MVAYLASIMCLHAIFINTMLHQYNGKMDWDYLWYASIRIMLLSFIPGAVAFILKSHKWYWSLLLGVVGGFISAVVYVKVNT